MQPEQATRPVSGVCRGGRACRLELANTPSAASWARRHTGDVLSVWGLSKFSEAATLVVSELVTNALRHGMRNGQPVEDQEVSGTTPVGKTGGYSGLVGVYRIVLTLRVVLDRFFVEVYDPDPNPPVFRERNSETEGGRGLFLVASVCRTVSYYRPPEGGKVVYAEWKIPTDSE